MSVMAILHQPSAVFVSDEPPASAKISHSAARPLLRRERASHGEVVRITESVGQLVSNLDKGAVS